MNEKIKICYVINRLSNAGPVSVVHNLISNINFNCYDVSILTLSHEIKNSQLSRFQLLPIKIFYVENQRRISAFGKLMRFRKILRQINPDIVHSHCIRSLVYSVLLRDGYKLLFTCHNYPGPLEKVLYGRFLGSVIAFANGIFSQKADKSIACSESIAMDLFVLKKRKISFINNGVNLPVGNYSEAEKRNLRIKLGLKPNVHYFISIGRLSPEKNMGFIIDAVNRMNNPQMGLIILGDGEQYKYLNSINKNQNVIFPGYQTDVYSYIISSNYYVSASTGEGLSMALLECMSVGLPMLLSDISSHRMVLSKFDTNVGFVFENNNIEDLISKMRQLLSLDTQQASERIKDVYNKLFTARVMAENYEKEYEKLTMINNN